MACGVVSGAAEDGLEVDLDEDLLRPFLEKPGGRFAVVPTAIAEKVFPSLPEGWKSFRAGGFNTANGKRVDLTLILKPS